MTCCTRRTFLTVAVSGTALSAAGLHAEPATAIKVWKDPNCGCCTGWVEHLRRNGFAVTVEETADLMPIKAQHGVPGALTSCHTAAVGPYTIEGHVPAAAIRRLLTERPQARGLAVPGMPAGSPGMDGEPEAYDVMLFGKAAPVSFGRFIGERPA
jgi:hypothetical protein